MKIFAINTSHFYFLSILSDFLTFLCYKEPIDIFFTFSLLLIDFLTIV